MRKPESVKKKSTPRYPPVRWPPWNRRTPATAAPLAPSSALDVRDGRRPPLTLHRRDGTSGARWSIPRAAGTARSVSRAGPAHVTDPPDRDREHDHRHDREPHDRAAGLRDARAHELVRVVGEAEEDRLRLPRG